ncbi:beta-ketoacyl-ACP synthase II [Haliovirga abyssi]|uniref:3-oxoacyl-[acyl-carrier-protein] synthase 2 n=1 Tax=Haliovirga abyssi TaxID=2996794 RepID=A0AAU9DI03_9FUSO|nr:beta-ketoacyl-ACP synthase II [Haliovirga abyssi]BDU50384.1 3-oxoacyl-[acyl-carrier-protein] synthase 2 [Haliovirga abyssi]
MKRVVITGIGLITALGTGKEKTWTNLLEGKTGISNIKSFDATGFASTVAGEVKDFDASEFIEKKELKKLARYTQFAVVASKMALEDAKLEITEENAENIGVIVSSGIGGIEIMEKQYSILEKRGPRKLSPFTIPAMIENMAAGNVSIYTGAKGPNKSIVTACASGTHSVGDAFEMIKSGRVEAMIAGGTEACITPLAVGGFCALKALSTKYNETPEKSSRPFNVDRDGFVMGEGAGILILEELESAKKRGAKIYAEIVGYGETGDAYHMTSPAPGGTGAARAFKMALKEGNIKLEDVDYINAHGTSTAANDRLETAAIKSVFGEQAYKLAVSSTKGATGHALGGAGGVEAAFLALAVSEGIMPPTINYENPDPECDLDYIPNKAEKRDIKVAMSSSLGFGGHNAVIAFKKYSN